MASPFLDGGRTLKNALADLRYLLYLDYEVNLKVNGVQK